MDTNLRNELKFLGKPIAIAFIVLFLFVVVILVGMNKVSALNSKIKTGKINEKTLSQKVSTLQTVENILAGDTTFLDVVLPSKGAVLYGLSQIKNQVINSGLTLSNLKTTNPIPEDDGVLRSSINFDVEGEESSIYSFLDSFSRVLPLMGIDKVSFSNAGGLTKATVTVNVFSAELPKKIPSLTGAVSELSQKDVELLKELATYQLPLFVEPSVSGTTAQKADPFN